MCCVQTLGALDPPTTGQEVSYASGTTTLKGYLVYPTTAAGKRPGVLVVHEWWGLNDHSRKAATKLAPGVCEIRSRRP